MSVVAQTVQASVQGAILNTSVVDSPTSINKVVVPTRSTSVPLIDSAKTSSPVPLYLIL
jgi:hypothetical protein